jgi:microcystin-dependent protein
MCSSISSTVLGRVARLALGFAIAVVPIGARAGAGSQPHTGEVRIFAFSFCPAGWLAANGQLVSIAEYDTLFNLYGTTFGGDGDQSFAMPDLRGRIPIGIGSGPGLTPRAEGEMGGSEEVTLTVPQLPMHTHPTGASSQTDNSVSPAGTLRGQKLRTKFHRTGGAANTTMAADAVAPAGGSQPVPNLPPYTAFSVCVCAAGIYPQQP